MIKCKECNKEWQDDTGFEDGYGPCCEPPSKFKLNIQFTITKQLNEPDVLFNYEDIGNGDKILLHLNEYTINTILESLIHFMRRRGR